uniref:Uncharacterized protein n=1 Tax=Anguilla anguilla TaxID=7936 RepID=A0A0E9W1J7_ANGAN
MSAITNLSTVNAHYSVWFSLNEEEERTSCTK